MGFLSYHVLVFTQLKIKRIENDIYLSSVLASLGIQHSTSEMLPLENNHFPNDLQFCCFSSNLYI